MPDGLGRWDRHVPVTVTVTVPQARLERDRRPPAGPARGGGCCRGQCSVLPPPRLPARLRRPRWLRVRLGLMPSRRTWSMSAWVQPRPRRRVPGPGPAAGRARGSGLLECPMTWALNLTARNLALQLFPWALPCRALPCRSCLSVTKEGLGPGPGPPRHNFCTGPEYESQ